MTLVRTKPMTLAERDGLRRVVEALRRTVSRDLTRSLEGTYGLREGSDPEAVSRLKLDADQLAERGDLLDLWEALGQRTDLLVREATFTQVNRLIAVRVAEALGILPESIANGRRSSGFRQTLEVAPLLGSDDDAGYWAYLRLCGDELSHDNPRLFDPRNPLLVLRPHPSSIDELIDLLAPDVLGAAHDAGSAWAAPDALGWTYQFFNTEDERQAMRNENPQPQDTRELAVRNQFFTPDYVVRFLAQNSLGRRLVEGGHAGILESLDLLVDAPTEVVDDADLSSMRVLDPACGSGHFLLGAYDLLELAWDQAGVGKGISAPAIVASLWGVDIDARAAQVAAAAISFRARRHLPDGDLPSPNIVCARSVPGGERGRAELLEAVDPSQRQFLTELMDQLERAPDLGSLLKVDELVSSDTARRMAFGGGSIGARARRRHDADQHTLIEAGIESGSLALDGVVDQVLAAAQVAADRVTSSPSDRVLAADGGDALRLVEVLTQRYDAVLMNPPFGEPIPGTKPYIKAAYPWIPNKDHNLFAAFVGRGVELCKAEGYLGAITARGGMFLTTFMRWREEVLLGNDLVVLADLGHRVMHEALVEAAAYVVRPGTHRHDRPATFLRLLRERADRRSDALIEVTANLRNGQADDRAFHLAPTAFDVVPGSPMAYWMSPSIRRLFTEYPRLEGHGAEVRQGLATGDDFRFLRAAWEIDPRGIARNRGETFAGKRWIPFAKGGEYSPFWSDIHLLIDFENDAQVLRGSPTARPQNLQYAFQAGLTWPRRTNSGFGMRLLPAGAAFGDKGPAAITKGPNGYPALGWLRTRFVQGLLDLSVSTADETSSGGQSRSYEVGLVQRLPWPGDAAVDSDSVRRMAELAARPDREDESARRFVGPDLTPLGGPVPNLGERHSAHLVRHLETLDLSHSVERGIAAALELDEDALRFFDDEVSPHPMSYPDRLDLDDEIEQLYTRPVDQTIRELLQRTGGRRSIANLTFIADRRVEVIAHGLEVSPRTIATVVERRGLLPAGEDATWAGDVLSYMTGCAFGRWDLRIGRDPSLAPALDPDLFAPVPLCPPGMLVGDDGFPVPEPPSGYPLPLTSHRILVDEAGHSADIVALIEQAAEVLLSDSRRNLGELLAMVGAKDLRGYLRKGFFKQHLTRYSKSRRKAPLYWPLTVPSRDWTVWLYAPELSREALFAASRHAQRRYDAGEAEIRRLESAQLQASTSGAPGSDVGRVRELAIRLDGERRLSEELRVLNRTLNRIAECGWVPDPDDGFVVNAAPLADLLPDWPRDPAATRADLRSGKLAWASAHQWRELL